jgi:cytochrome d ubiquinol oxidase subunit II
MPPLETVWFLLVGVLLAGYTILDGFDLGAGMLHLFVAKSDAERRQVINSVGPVWDGNEVWLLTGGGAIFAAFPKVYATVFSGLYLALMLVLAALILRAVCLEFRSKLPGSGWRRTWDVVFAVSSFLPALLFGVAVGNLLRGLPLDREQEFAGTFIGLLNPFALVTGLFAVAMFLVQGAGWLVLKTEGTVRERATTWAKGSWLAFVALWVVATIAARVMLPSAWRAFTSPAAWLVPLVFAAAAGGFRALLAAKRPAVALLLSSVAIAALWGLVGLGLYPNLVPALGGGEALSVTNASSSPITLRVMFVIALIGMPIVIAYTIFIYRRFKGPVQMDEHSY